MLNKQHYEDLLKYNAVDFPIAADTSREYFNKLFEKGVEMPLGNVKLGKNQYDRLVAKNRLDLIEAIYQTLKNPVLLIKTDIDTYVKSFVKESGRQRNIASIVITKDGNKISISTHERRMGQLWEQIKNANDVVENDIGNHGAVRNESVADD